MESESPEPPAAPSSLLLLAVPWAFTQDDLLTTDKFLDRAKELGYRLSISELRELHEERSLLPLLQIVDEVDEARVTSSVIGTASSTRLMEVSRAAASGQLRDPWADKAVSDYERPPSAEPGTWWDGFLWSSWQLIDLGDMGPFGEAEFRSARAAERRTRTVLLCALAARHVAAIRKQMSIPGGLDWRELVTLRDRLSAAEVLATIGISSEVLAKEGEYLLGQAHFRDPIHDWLPLVRRMSSRSWDQMTGSAGFSMQMRIAAEVLLMTYEEVVEAGGAEPLPDFSGSRAWHPLLDRIAPARETLKPLEAVLADFGIVPNARLLVLCEGKTELIHFPRLIAAFSNPLPEFIRVQQLGGVDVNPQLLARFVVTPRLDQDLGDGWMLHAPPTAIMIVVDEEGRWATEKQRSQRIRAIREGIREEVRLQGGDIDDETLDYLVHLRTWGPGTYYELANFSDDELVDAILVLVEQAALVRLTRDQVREIVTKARRGELSMDAVVGQCRTSKPELAEQLWPVLLAKAEGEITSGNLITPVVEVLAAAVDVANTVHPQVRGLKDPRTGNDPAGSS